jgi:putative ABC transport system ATP-binding protein
MPALLELRDVWKIYRLGDVEVHALRGVSVDVAAGEFVAVMGASGSGKSTFMNIVGCLDEPTSGSYRLDGVPVSEMSADDRAVVRNRRLGFVFQHFNLLPRTTAHENVELPLVYAGVPFAEQRERAHAALGAVGLAGRENHVPSQLSGGQQQRVAIARALVNDPQVVLADEPTGNLDTETSIEIMDLFTRLHRTQGVTIVLVTHEPDIAAYADRRITFRDGHVVSDVRAGGTSRVGGFGGRER